MKTDQNERSLGWTTWTLILLAAAIVPSCGGVGHGQGNLSGSGLNPSLSADGTLVAFDSSSVNGANSSSSQVFLFNNADGTTRQMTGNPNNGQFANGSNPALSGDGTTIAFVSTATVATTTTTTTTTTGTTVSTTGTTTGSVTGTSVGSTGTTVATTGTTLGTTASTIGTTVGTTDTTMGTTTGGTTVVTTTTGLDSTSATGSTIGSTTGTSTGFTTGIVTGTPAATTTGTSTGFTTGIVTGTSAGTTSLTSGTTTGVTTGIVTGTPAGTTGMTSGTATGVTTGIVTGTSAGTTSLTSGTSTGFTTGIVTGAMAAVSSPGSNQIVVVTIAAGSSRVVSVTSEGIVGNGESTNPSLSANGGLVAFESTSTNLIVSTSSLAGQRNIFVTSGAGGATQLVSFGFGGSVPNGDSMNPMISADGRSVVFESVATNLTVSAVPGSQPLSRIFVRDLQSGQILQVTPGQGALLPPNGDSTRPSISGDGRFVAFESTATNLVGQGGTGSAGRNIFVWDRQSGQTTLVTAAAAGSSSPSADGDSLNPSISADGRFVAFKSRATNLTTSPSGGMASPGNLNVFVHDLQSGATTLVGVAGTGSTTGTVGSPGATDDNGSQDPVLSRDGTWVAFTQTSSSSSPSVSQVFLTNRITGQIQQVSGLPIGSSSTSGTTTGTTTTTTGSTTGTTSGTTGGTTSSAPTFRGLTR